MSTSPHSQAPTMGWTWKKICKERSNGVFGIYPALIILTLDAPSVSKKLTKKLTEIFISTLLCGSSRGVMQAFTAS